jgi:type I restriction enzyme, S subunit
MNEVNKYSRGIVTDRNRLYWDEFRQMPSSFPPVEEQTAIANYLDYNAALVSRFARTKRRQIEILNEQRTALAKALLAQATATCSLVRLRFICSKFGSGVTPRGGATNYVEAGVPFLRSQNVHFGELRLNDVAYIPLPIHESMSGTHVRSGDVLLNITGASIGRVCAVPSDLGEANVNQHVCIIRPIANSLDARYLAVCLSLPSMQDEI